MKSAIKKLSPFTQRVHVSKFIYSVRGKSFLKHCAFILVSDEYIINPETGPVYILKFPTDIEHPCEPRILNVGTEKNPNLPVRGLQCSKNGFLWIAFQEGAMPQAKGKLIVMTLLDFQQLLKYPQVWSNDSATQ